MKQPMQDQEITRLLRDLPEETAPRGFTRDVLRRLDETPTQPKGAPGSSFPGWRLATATTVLLLALGLGLGLGWLGDREPEAREQPVVAASEPRDETRARLEALREEHRRLAQEMEVLQDLTRENQPFVYLGGDERVDFVYGLDEPGSAQGIEPAAHRNAYQARRSPP